MATPGGDHPRTARARPTARDVAALAGVSVATVSRVTNASGTVSPELRRRTEEVIARTGYRPDRNGRALAGQRHHVLGLVVPGLLGPYFAELVDGVDSVATEHDTAVHVLSTHLATRSREHVLDLAARVDGLALLGATADPADVTELGRRIPVVVVAGRAPAGVPSIRVANREPVAELTRHLLVDHGRRRLAFVGHLSSPDGRARWDGFRRAHEDLGLRPADAVQVGYGQGDGLTAADLLFGAGRVPGRPRPDAVVCANDELALGVLVGALGRGLQVPGDVAVTGFDGLPAAALVRPGLTTVHQPIHELGSAAARLLLDRVGRVGVAPAEDLVLATTVVRRGSCGCPETDRGS